MTAAHARVAARRLLDASTAVVVVPTRLEFEPRFARIGIGYGGGNPAEAALRAAAALVAARPGQVSHVDVIHVDDSVSGVCETDEVVRSRREVVIAWRLTQVGTQIPAPVRTLRPIGDPAGELARLSCGLDLLVLGTRGRAPLRRALTGSVSAKLIETTRCALLVVPPKWPCPASRSARLPRP